MTEVVRTSWGERISKSVGGILFGVVLFFGSFVLLWWNEGSQDLSKVAKEAVLIESTQAAPESAQGGIVAIAGIVDTPSLLGDNLFLKPAKYLRVNRSTEVFAWQEDVTSTTKKDAVGGGETTTKEYSYKTGWVSTARSSSDFNAKEKAAWESKYGVRIDNSKARNRYFQDYNGYADVIQMGNYSMDGKSIAVPSSHPLNNLDKAVELRAQGGINPVINGDMIFLRKGGDSGDNVGDERLRYSVLESGFKGTAFGKLTGSTLEPFLSKGKGADVLKNKATLFRIFASDKEAAIEKLHGEYVFWKWILRLIGFLMMWIGLGLILDPISKVLDIVGVVGSVSKFVVSAVTFAVTLSFSVITMIVGALAHNVIGLIVTLVLVVGIVVFVVMTAKKKQPAPVKTV